MVRGSFNAIVRHVEGPSEFVVDTSHLPLLITTWFASPTLELAEAYTRWFHEYVERCRISGRRFVILDDASRAGRPAPPVRGCLSKIQCPPEVVIDRVVVVNSSAIRGAITALSWITGNPIKTATTVEDGVRDCLALLDAAGVAPPREFEFELVQPSASP